MLSIVFVCIPRFAVICIVLYSLLGIQYNTNATPAIQLCNHGMQVNRLLDRNMHNVIKWCKE